MLESTKIFFSIGVVLGDLNVILLSGLVIIFLFGGKG
jgi:hypothetical protein